MKGLSKFFTPTLGPDDRKVLFGLLGLASFPFQYREFSGATIVRAAEFTGLRGNPFLSPEATRSDFGDKPRVNVRHDPHLLTVEPAQRVPALWEELFPYPFQLLSLLFLPSRLAIDVSPAGFFRDLHNLWLSLIRLEARLARSELSCLWVRGKNSSDQANFPVLFHFVRKKRIRVGTAFSLLSLASEGDPRTLKPEVLKEHFGTHVALHVLDMSAPLSPSPENPIAALTFHLERLLQKADSPVESQAGVSPTRDLFL